MGARIIIPAGTVFGELTVIAPGKSTNAGGAKWRCLCSCGNQVDVRASSLRIGKTRSCGCKTKQFNAEKTAERNTKHLHACSGRKTAEYICWENMKKRCSPTCRQAKDYFNRGIHVCDRWAHPVNGFTNFLVDMGLRPTKSHSLERVDNNLGYAPENCVWALRYAQNRNRRSVKIFWGKSMAEWTRELNLSVDLIPVRLKSGWAPLAAIFTPPNEPPICVS